MMFQIFNDFSIFVPIEKKNATFKFSIEPNFDLNNRDYPISLFLIYEKKNVSCVFYIKML